MKMLKLINRRMEESVWRKKRNIVLLEDAQSV